ncbi:MAG TPA: hypothetical protein ENI85_19955, partial [Deltaproteobacteria bacterium]|nr:hypothetical protein [Deltaproteobacteria bacterium]
MPSPSARVSAFLVAVAAMWVLPAFAAERTFPLNHKRIRIEKLIDQVATETRRTILFDDQVRGNVSIVTQRPVTEGEAWSILDASLSMLGFSLLPSTAGNWRIAKMATAVGESPFTDAAGSSAEAFVTALIPLEAADLQTVMNVLDPLSGARVTLVPFEPTRSLIASGPERAIARLMTIARELDRLERLPIGLRVLRYRGVDEIESLVEARFASGSSSPGALQVWSDVRTNSILFRGSADEVARLRRFLARLDRPAEGGGEIRILRVLNRDAEEVAELIRGLGQSGAASRIASEDIGGELAGADFSIVVDKASRSLVVRADPGTQRLIREVLEIFDEPPQQIAVDITISELRTPRNFTLGFAFNVPLLPGNEADELVGRLISSPTPGGFLAQPTQQTRLFGRVARDANVPFEIDGGNGVTIPIEDTGVIDAGEFRARTEVLIQPHLVVTAGERHEIFVGNNVPVPVTEEGGLAGGTDAADAGDGSALSQVRNLLSRTIRFERTDIGIRLDIEAKAGHRGRIQLDLDVEISSIAPSLAGDITKVGPT